MELGEHLHSLSILHSDGANLQSISFRPRDFSLLFDRLSQLRSLAESTSGKVNREEEQQVQCRTHVQTSERHIEQLQRWIEQSEDYLNKRLDQHGVLNLNGAKELHEQHKVFLEERRRMLTIYQNLMGEDEHLTGDQYELKVRIQSLSMRWLEITRKSDELTPKYDRQYSAWLLFESELNAFREQILVELEQRLEPISHTDLREIFDLHRLELLLNELRVR
jgi:septal ring factor EnvC (AmiA/AmiB activator)